MIDQSTTSQPPVPLYHFERPSPQITMTYFPVLSDAGNKHKPNDWTNLSIKVTQTSNYLLVSVVKNIVDIPIPVAFSRSLVSSAARCHTHTPLLFAYSPDPCKLTQMLCVYNTLDTSLVMGR